MLKATEGSYDHGGQRVALCSSIFSRPEPMGVGEKSCVKENPFVGASYVYQKHSTPESLSLGLFITNNKKITE